MKTFSRKGTKVQQKVNALQQAENELASSSPSVATPSGSSRSSGTVLSEYGTPSEGTPCSKTPLARAIGRVAFAANKENECAQQLASRAQQGGKVAKVAVQYSRRVAPNNAKQREAAAHSQYLAAMRAHFAEVDEFELAEESPLPPGARRQDDCPVAVQPGRSSLPGSRASPLHQADTDSIRPAGTGATPEAGAGRVLHSLVASETPERLDSLSPLSGFGSPLDPSQRRSDYSDADLAQLHAPESRDSHLDSPLPSTSSPVSHASQASPESSATPEHAASRMAVEAGSGQGLAETSSSIAATSGQTPPAVGNAATGAMGQTPLDVGDAAGSSVPENKPIDALQQQKLRLSSPAAAPAAGWQIAAHHGLTPVSEGSEASPALSGRSSLPDSSQMSTPGTSASSPERSSEPSHPHMPTPSSTKPMALGLSRRSSVMVPRLDSASRTSLGLSCFSLAADDLPMSARRSSLAPLARDVRLSQARQSLIGRLSTRFSIGDGLARLSTGLSDTMQYMGLLNCNPAGEGACGQIGARRSSVGLAADPVGGRLSILASRTSLAPGNLHGVSSIAESPELTPTPSSPCGDADGEPHTPPCMQSMAKKPSPAADLQASALCSQFEQQLGLEEAPAPEEATLTPLQQLLKLCGQELITDKLPSMTDLLGQHVDLTQIRKIGEGTFGEAFKAGKVVFKIVPMEGSRLVNGEVQKLSAEILAEVAISLTLSELRGKPGGSGPFGNSNITSGFVETYGVGICRGAYAEALCREWHAWDARNESENDPVDDFPGDQLYVVFVVADGGADLEHFEVRSFKEAKSILLQVALTLAVAEEACQFEHRDLHWGNLLIQRGATGTAHFRLRDTSIEMADAGVAVTLIDFTLSRLNTVTGEVAFLDLSADPELFQGPKGDCQAETYRRMKKATKDHWEAHRPETNTLWMHYLADTMLTLKKFPCSSADKRELRNFRKRALTYGSCGELVWDEFFSGSWLAGAAS